ncbi:Clg1p NDAI_0I02950 [Naumovozyma dairenensis CBS 421]|uniref:Cyclin N-terminal domain-containing protein n=1 Tax=Naumovozyma dairenensis (strain ATCC 10597 / BCRC 20456 / CBS 421 / NBRC 0211 / NRRL Y-12639) TaxID=1071378 RepID=G0WGF2_NAUDC|nr:hypothetical protein NDAI_0I02950 [Naumovozyma dairenensis CBS 421]CCD26863.1 hypothetical protein NDAI_0I02950 [Naumovozyma dairenensis CBS 421]
MSGIVAHHYPLVNGFSNKSSDPRSNQHQFQQNNYLNNYNSTLSLNNNNHYQQQQPPTVHQLPLYTGTTNYSNQIQDNGMSHSISQLQLPLPTQVPQVLQPSITSNLYYNQFQPLGQQNNYSVSCNYQGQQQQQQQQQPTIKQYQSSTAVAPPPPPQPLNLLPPPPGLIYNNNNPPPIDQTQFSAPLLPPINKNIMEPQVQIQIQSPQQQQQQQQDQQQVNGGVSQVLDYDIMIMSEFFAKHAFLAFSTNHSKLNSDSNSIETSQIFIKGIYSVLNATRLPSVSIFLAIDYLFKYIDKINNNLASIGGNTVNVIYQNSMIAFVLANKFNDDKTFTNKSWAQATGMDIKIINEYERNWLQAFQWKLFDDKFILYEDFNKTFNYFVNERKNTVITPPVPLLPSLPSPSSIQNNYLTPVSSNLLNDYEYSSSTTTNNNNNLTNVSSSPSNYYYSDDLMENYNYNDASSKNNNLMMSSPISIHEYEQDYITKNNTILNSGNYKDYNTTFNMNNNDKLFDYHSQNHRLPPLKNTQPNFGMDSKWKFDDSLNNYMSSSSSSSSSSSACATTSFTKTHLPYSTVY